MEDRDACCSMKDQMCSDYDSDETIVDDSIPGSDEEIDELHLKRLFPSSEISATSGRSRAGQQSPEIQLMCKSVTRIHLDRMKTTRQVCEILSEEEASQSLLRNWTKESGNLNSVSSSKKSCYSEILLDHKYFSGLCEDSQHLIQSTECEVEESHNENESPEISLLSGTIIQDHSNPEKETVLMEDGQPQTKAPDLILTSERSKVETASEETVCSLEPPDSEKSRNLPININADLHRDTLLGPLSDSESMTQIGDMVNSQEYLSFMEVSTDDDNTLISEVLTAINCIQSPEVQSTRDQLGHTIVSDDNDVKIQILMTQQSEYYDDHTQEPKLTFVQEDGDHGTETYGDIFPIQETDKEESEETSWTEENAPQKPSPFHAAERHVSSHCPGAEQHLSLTEASRQGSKETCTMIAVDQSHTTAADDPAVCTRFSPSITNNAKPSISEGRPGTCAVGVRRSRRIPKPACDVDHIEQEPPAMPPTQKADISTDNPKASEKVLMIPARLHFRRSTGTRRKRKKYSDSLSNVFDGKNEVRESSTFKMTATVKKHMTSKSLGNINKRNFMGETKLHQASKKGDLKLVNALIEAGIDINQKDNAGWAAIHEASCRGYTEIILALLQAGADVNSKGLDGILPIHDAVFSNHFKAVELLLEFGADPYERDSNQENAFDKCCNDKITEHLKSHSSYKETAAPGTETQPNIVTGTQKYKTREKCAMETLATLQETERRQAKLLSTELQTSEEAEKYIEEMHCIQDVLSKIVILQKNERDTLAKKYRASVDSFRQGILRDKIAKLASRQKVLLKVVQNQKEVALRIMAYQQGKRSDANNGEKSSSLRDCDTAPGRNPISALCTANEWLHANIANGSTMVTDMPAVCRVAHSESNQSHRSFMRDISGSVMSRTGAVPTNAMVSERVVQHSSNMSSNEVPESTERGLFSLKTCSTNAPRDLHEDTNDDLGFTAPGTNSPSPIPINDTLNITDKININVKTINRQITDERHQATHSSRPNLQEASYQAVVSGSSVLDGVLDNGRPQHPVTGHRSASWEQCINLHTADRLSPKRQLRCIAAARKIRKVPMIKLIKMGMLKPGDDVLCFQLQDYSHKATLLPDGRIKDGSGATYRDPAQWVKALLGSNIAVSWKYVANKVTYLGEKLLSLMNQENFAPKECNHHALQHQTTELQHCPAHTVPQQRPAHTVPQQRPALTVLQERPAHTVPQHCPAHTVLQERPAHTVPQQCPAHTVLQERSACTVLQVKEILLIDKSEFFPSHIMDQYWEEFMTSDSEDL